jgi:CheY-like chemotaxis protein
MEKRCTCVRIRPWSRSRESVRARAWLGREPVPESLPEGPEAGSAPPRESGISDCSTFWRSIVIQTNTIETTPMRTAVALRGLLPLTTVLSVSPIEADHVLLEQIFGALRWTVHRSVTVRFASTLLGQRRASVVICERDLAPGSWRDILAAATVLPQPPCVIVASRLADDRLWVEALNAGAYDVLSKPFKAEEVIRAAIWATRRWRDQYVPDGGSAVSKRRAA